MKPFTYRADPDETLSEAVIAAVASVSNCRPTAGSGGQTTRVLPPLYDAIDTDALDALFSQSISSTRDETREPSGKVVFSYHGFSVTAHSDGSVVIDSA